jgi:hypothetical protein
MLDDKCEDLDIDLVDLLVHYFSLMGFVGLFLSLYNGNIIPSFSILSSVCSCFQSSSLQSLALSPPKSSLPLSLIIRAPPVYGKELFFEVNDHQGEGRGRGPRENLVGH